ncbi:hypothetical protein BO71DRAFT_200250 [Aspergillus ellipticus CBS 707.79]|uniref:Uncharacterized protein n=1 Tax=Aspergillus ellipticus CBS 707.79 TaxID=1448320 RepID=A0A319DDR8_9EURO|nr:hypothetical protein BO71DRAFT_200250 [Aspergillus ellipticus CBS 707.79]
MHASLDTMHCTNFLLLFERLPWTFVLLLPFPICVISCPVFSSSKRTRGSSPQTHARITVMIIKPMRPSTGRPTERYDVYIPVHPLLYHIHPPTLIPFSLSLIYYFPFYLVFIPVQILCLEVTTHFLYLLGWMAGGHWSFFLFGY